MRAARTVPDGRWIKPVERAGIPFVVAWLPSQNRDSIGSFVVIPAKAGIHSEYRSGIPNWRRKKSCRSMTPRFRWDDHGEQRHKTSN